MKTTYTFGRRVPGTPAEVRPAVEAALKSQGFGIITEVDIAAVLKDKIGVHRSPYLILGACNPQLSYQAIELDESVGTLFAMQRGPPGRWFLDGHRGDRPRGGDADRRVATPARCREGGSGPPCSRRQLGPRTCAGDGLLTPGALRQLERWRGHGRDAADVEPVD